MAAPRHLSRAPITEAVIDFRARTTTEVTVEKFAELAGQLGEHYAAPKQISLLEFGVQQTPDKKFEGRQVDHGRIGSRYESKDGKQIAQFRRDGFTFSRLAPYTRWEEVFAEASRLYRIYRETAQPEEITRIAVRYINQMLFDEQEVADFSPFLTAPPPFPREVTTVLTGFVTRVQVQDPETGVAGTITQAAQQGTIVPGKVAVILDLDIYELGNKSPLPEALLPRFETLRNLKNRYYFASITEKTADLYV